MAGRWSTRPSREAEDGDRVDKSTPLKNQTPPIPLVVAVFAVLGICYVLAFEKGQWDTLPGIVFFTAMAVVLAMRTFGSRG